MGLKDWITVVFRYLADYLTFDQAADALRIPRHELGAFCKAEGIVPVQVRPGVWRIRNTDVQAVLDSEAFKAAHPEPAGWSP